MMMRLVVRRVHSLLLMALPCLLISGCSRSIAETLPPEVSTEMINDVAKAEQQFTLDLYAALAEDAGGKNLFFSPHSVYSVMSMIAEGADGETAEQMAKVLGLESSEGAGSQFASTHQGLAGLAHSLKAKGKAKDLHTLLNANAVWVDQSFPLAPAYQQALEPYLPGGGGVFACDFHNNYSVEAERIDQWCDDNTKGRITSIMPEASQIDATNLQLVLTNAVYFEGKWLTPFEPKDTKKQKFQLAGGEDIEVDMMNASNFAKARYGAVDEAGEWFATPKMFDPGAPQDQQRLYPEGKGFTIVELPYKGDRLSMVLVAPRSRAELGHIERLLTADRLTEWVGKMESRPLSRLRLPKLDLATNYDMTQKLADMGMELAFTPPAENEGADFSHMVASGESLLYVSMVLHKATLEVDEQGTVAAAATAGLLATRSAAIQGERPFHPEFLADRPFLMLIRDRESGHILFMGRINDPRGDSSEG